MLRCQRRADMESNSLIGNGEWKALISEQYGDLYSVVASAGLRYFETTYAFTTTGAAFIAEPIDMLATVGVDYIANASGQRDSLSELMTTERQYLAGLTGTAQAYSLVDDRLMLYPVPPAGQQYEWLYIAQSPDLTTLADIDCVDLVTPDGEAFLMWGVTVKALAKSESDVQLALAERESARVRLCDWATLRAFNSARRRVIADEPYGPDSGGYLPGDYRR